MQLTSLEFGLDFLIPLYVFDNLDVNRVNQFPSNKSIKPMSLREYEKIIHD